MGYQPLEHLLPQAGYSIYKLVCMASKRAKELADGAPSLIDISSSSKTATVSLEEIWAGKVVLREVSSQFDVKNKKKTSKDSKASKSENSGNQSVAQEQHV